MTAALAHRRHRIKAACLRAADAARAPMRAVWLKKADDAIRLPPEALNAPASEPGKSKKSARSGS